MEVIENSLLSSINNNPLKIFRLFCNYRKDLCDKKWILRKFVHPLQNDGVSCGVFVCMFFESLLNVDVREKELKIREKCPYRFRKVIFDELYKENLKYVGKVNLCCICGKKDSDQELLGFDCIHSYHSKCLKKNECEQCEIIDCLLLKYNHS